MNAHREDTSLSSPQESASLSETDLSDILRENGISEPLQTEDFSEEDEREETLDDLMEYMEDETSQELETSSTDSSQLQDFEKKAGSIPRNSPSILVDEATTRFSGAEWFSEIQKTRVIIAGIGGIGSNLAFQLARMVPAGLVLYDDDEVERVNMAGQLYSNEDIGKAKVNAMADMISAYTSMRQVYAVQDRFAENTAPGDIMMCGFDNMEARSTFFQSWQKHLLQKSLEDRKRCLFLDGRLSMDTLQILCIRGDDMFNIKRYQNEFLFSDSQADATVCSMKQTTYLACMIGSLMTNLFTNFIAGTLDPVIPYDLPFFTEYDAQSMIFKTEN